MVRGLERVNGLVGKPHVNAGELALGLDVYGATRQRGVGAARAQSRPFCRKCGQDLKRVLKQAQQRRIVKVAGGFFDQHARLPSTERTV